MIKFRMGNLALAGDVKMIIQYRIGKTKWDQIALYKEDTLSGP